MIEFIFCESEEDLKHALTIRRNVFIYEMAVPESIEIDENDTLSGSCKHILVLKDSDPIGTVRCNLISDKILKIQRFCFIKDCRGNGYGRSLLKFIEKEFKAKGFSYIYLEAKFTASDFYKKCGYSPKGEIFIEANVPHIKMEKVL